MKYLILSIAYLFTLASLAESCEQISGADVYQGSNIGFGSGIPGGDDGALSENIQANVSEIQKELLLKTKLGQFIANFSYDCDDD